MKTEFIQLDFFNKEIDPNFRKKEAETIFKDFKIEVVKLHSKGFRSSCKVWWRSRFADWVNPSNNDNHDVWKQKHHKQKRWPTIWRLYKNEMCI